VRYQFVLALWGRKYLDYFFDVALPTWMTTGNLLGFASREAEFDVYTTAADADELSKSEQLRALSAFLPIRISIVSGMDFATGSDDDKYVTMTKIHCLAIKRADEREAAVFFLGPDVAIADGTLARARDLLESGKRLIMVGSARVASAGFIADVKRRFNPHASVAAQVTPRDLVDLIVRHPHVGNATFTWGNPEFVNWPSHLFFPVGADGFVQRGFHLHPIAINAEHRGLAPEDTVDGSWLTKIVPDQADWYIMQDSDEGYAVDFGAPAERLIPARVRSDPVLHVAGWAKRHTKPLQWWLAQHVIAVHRTPISQEWLDVAAASGVTLGSILENIASAPEWVKE
jgi:hypothetical protein